MKKIAVILCLCVLGGGIVLLDPVTRLQKNDHPNSQSESGKMTKDGKKEGVWKSYYANGQLREVTTVN